VTFLDLIVFALYGLGIVLMAVAFARRMKNMSEMFNAGGQSPWWLSGLSAFMTTFSAGTFVIWGGMAYRQGMVGVTILFVIGISAIAVGWFLAARWKTFGYESAAEFLTARFGRSLVQFYTWLQGAVGVFTMGGAVYALAVIVCALVPLPAGHVLADPATGQLSVTIVSLALCAMVIIITSTGGLWAVLMTDALQFIILTVSVVVVVPLIVTKVGGMGAFVENAPPGFFSPTAGEITWVFLAGWTLVFFFKLGGEWAYVQRFACVPTAVDARKSSYLFGVLYLVSPLIWMIPPMAYRLIDPNANHEQAYILACKTVLPSGVMGLMVAAMCSATASTVTTQLNVFAGAFTTEIYRQFRPAARERELVFAGRIITLLLGGICVAGALLIPRLGSYTGYILGSVAMLTGPLVLPSIWGLFSRKIGLGAAWFVTLSGVLGGIILKFGFGASGWFGGVGMLTGLNAWIQSHVRLSEIILGTVFPLLLLVMVELFARQTSPGWERVWNNRSSKVTAVNVLLPSVLPAQLCGRSTLAVGVLMLVLAFVDRKEAAIFVAFAILLGTVGGSILYGAKRVVTKSGTPMDR
jgi:solute:Na+ symporter, SSS family